MSSSPFELFRRNLKPLMVLLTLLAIFAFVVLPSLEVYMRNNAGVGGQATTLASFDGGEYDVAKVNYFTRQHYLTVQFLRQLAEITIARGGSPKVSGFQYNTEQNAIQSLGINANPSDQNSVLTMRFAAEAKQANLDLDDTAIRSWLTAFTDGRLSDAEINGVLQNATRNQLGLFHLYEQLRSQLLSEAFNRQVMAGLAVEGRPIVPPAQQWELFLRLNRRAVADAYAVNVAEFIAQTSDRPSSEEISRVYEDGKSRFPDDQSPQPAFRRPYVANIQYLAGSLDEFIDREIENFSEEQLRAEYQRRLEGGDFRMPEQPVPPAQDQPADLDAPAEDSAAPADAAPMSDEQTPPAPSDSPAAPEQPVAEQPAAEPTLPAAVEETPAAETPAPQPQPAEPQSSDNEAPQNEPAPAQPAAGSDGPAADADEPAAEDEAPSLEGPSLEGPAPTDSSTLSPASQEPAVMLVAARAQEESQTADADEQPAADEVPADPAPADPTPADPAPATETPATEEPLEPALGQPAPTENPSPTETPSATEDQPAGETTEQPSPAERTQPFEEVREQIARSLAMEAASTKLNAAISEVEKVMRTYFNELAIAGPHVDRRPQRPDLQALADRLGLSYRETGMIDARQLQDQPIVDSFGRGEGMQRGNPFLQTMYIDRPSLFTPVRTEDPQARVSYVAWKIDERAASIPTLEEARDEVILAIRTAEARKLARAEAEKLAKDFNTSDQPVRQLIPEERSSLLFESVGPFSWMNSFGFGMQPFMGNVPELDSVGEAFMRQVFTSELDQWGVAANAPETVFYVVRPTEFSPSTDELHQRFSQLIQRFQASTLAVEEVLQIRDGFYQALDKRTGFRWNEEYQE